MKTLDAPDAWGYSIFCDDIRVEVGAKITYVGSYSGRMLVHGVFPFTIHKLAIGVVYFQRKSALVLPVKYWIFFPGDSDEKPSVEASPPTPDADAFFKASDEERAKLGIERGEVFANYVPLMFGNLVLQRKGAIKVRAVRGDSLVRLGSLEIVQASAEPAADPAPLPPQP